MRTQICIATLTLVAAHHMACGDDSATTTTTTAAGPGSSSANGTGGSTSSASAGGNTTGSTGGSTPNPACDQVQAKAEAYKAAHPGNGGKDWDILTKSPAEIAADPAAQELMALCGPDERPVIPILAWEYGGNDHPWINPQASALFYCVYIPVVPSTEHWTYEPPPTDHVIADVYIGCPELNPCNADQGADQVMNCLGDMTNIEIFVDTASMNDGADVGLNLSEASTDLYLIMGGGMKVHLYTGL